MSRRLLLICTAGALPGAWVAWANPVHSTFFKLVFLACAGGTWLGIMILLWQHKAARVVWGMLLLLMSLAFALPGRDMDVEELRRDYVQRLVGFEGTRYFWGGENSRGIDCSGLPRRAFRDALLSHGIRTANGRALRAWLEQWWFDASARAMGEEYRGHTMDLGIDGIVREMDDASLLAGDLVVTVGGVHVLVYMGEGNWIQADPGVGKVQTLHGRRDENGWFHSKVTMHRWRLLEEE